MVGSVVGNCQRHGGAVGVFDAGGDGLWGDDMSDVTCEVRFGTLEWALIMRKKHYFIRRRAWPKYQYFNVDEIKNILFFDDIIATDWMAYDTDSPLGRLAGTGIGNDARYAYEE